MGTAEERADAVREALTDYNPHGDHDDTFALAALASLVEMAEQGYATKDEWETLQNDARFLFARVNQLQQALAQIIEQASPREWETSGHPMNSWTKREPIIRIAREVLGREEN